MGSGQPQTPQHQMPALLSSMGLRLVPLREDLPPTGRTQWALANWRVVTADPWVLSTMEGYRISLLATPRQHREPPPHRFSEEEEVGLNDQLKELFANFLGLMTFADQDRKITIRVESNSLTAFAFVNKQGGMKSWALCKLAEDLWQWAIDHELHLIAVHVPGRDNHQADALSRKLLQTTTEWEIPLPLFAKIAAAVSVPLILDLFAARHNARLPQYVSWKPDPLALATDAFSIPAVKWENAYAFPPFNLVGRCLIRVRQERIKCVILVTPVWPHQLWYPQLLQLLSAAPILLPMPQLRDPYGNRHPLHDSLQLGVWIISGLPSMTEVFRRRLKTCGFLPGGHPRTRPMTQLGDSLIAGVVNESLIVFRPRQLW